MPSRSVRPCGRVAVATGLFTMVGLGIVAAPAAAAMATISVQPEIALAEETVSVSGTCEDPTAETAVVSLVQRGEVLLDEAVTLAGGAYTVTVPLSSATTGPASAEVTCFAYGTADAVGDGQAPLLILADDLFDYEEIAVTASSAQVELGASTTISGRCPAGSGAAYVTAGSDGADAPFADVLATVAADGTFSAALDVDTAAGAAPGAATVSVLCAEDATLEAEFTAFGIIELTITSVAAAPVRAAPAEPMLAETGWSEFWLTVAGVALIAGGTRLVRLSHRMPVAPLVA